MAQTQTNANERNLAGQDSTEPFLEVKGKARSHAPPGAKQLRLHSSSCADDSRRALHATAAELWGKTPSHDWTAPAPGDMAAWIPTTSGWTGSAFDAELAWLDRRGEDAQADLRGINRLCIKSIASLRAGLSNHIRHAAHLIGQVAGAIDEPYDHEIAQHGACDSLAAILERGFGPDPRVAFANAMAAQRIVPTNRVVDAGAVLRRFHVAGDSEHSTHGWAILHRCPSAGSFGSWRTGEVHQWHSQPERMDSDQHQFEADYLRALADRKSRITETGASFIPTTQNVVRVSNQSKSILNSSTPAAV